MAVSLAFKKIAEPYAAAFFKHPGRSRFYRFAFAQRSFWEAMPLPAYKSGPLYPYGRKYQGDYGVSPDYSFTFAVNKQLLLDKGIGHAALAALEQEQKLLFPKPRPVHSVGGFIYTHSLPNYPRILSEGLDSYESRVRQLEEGDFRAGLLEILAGLRIYHERCLKQLRLAQADPALLTALERVPFQPATNLYEALLAWNFIFYADGCDNPGRLDAGLSPYYRGEDITDLLRAFFENVDQNDGWSGALGPDNHPLTLQCLHAVQGLRRPSLELRITDSTSAEVWQAACAALLTGCGQPAFYNEKAYQAQLAHRFPHIPEADRLRFNGGGCTETMLEGISNVGSLDAGINLLLIFSEHLAGNLSQSADFTSFYQGLLEKTRQEVAKTLDLVNEHRQQRSIFRPQPVRSLLIDDCIDRGLDFNAGGARYYWSVINLAGLVNVIDSLLAVKALVYDDKVFSAEDFLQALSRQDPSFLQKLRACPCYGVDDSAADQLAARYAKDMFASLDQRTPYLGGAFLPASIQFTTFADAGQDIPATPDGRAAGQPLADSIGAVHGKDKKGPTALLNSAAQLPQQMALGTPVLNIRLGKRLLSSSLPALVQGYFSQGGMQVQVSCLSHSDMLAALADPQKHENLIVRIGGYSEYFNRLSPALKQAVIERTEFGENS